MSNKWLDSTVAAYEVYFGRTAFPVVYDVGSRDGDDGEELAARITGGTWHDFWDRATIVLFEPNPSQIEVIREAYPKATLVTKAMSNKVGKQKFVKITGNKDEVGSSSLSLKRLDAPYGDGKTVIEVETDRLDNTIRELGHDGKTIDIMKVDVEGFTYEVLQGLGEYLKDVRVLHLETETKKIAQNKTNLDVFKFMRDQGFLCYARDHQWGPDIEDQVWVNAQLLKAKQ